MRKSVMLLGVLAASCGCAGPLGGITCTVR